MPSPSKRPLATPATEHKKRRRTSAEELRILEDAYVVNTLPSSEERARLAERTGMTPRAVQIWFQNKRQTEKRKLTQAMYPNVMIIPIHHPVDPSISTPGKSAAVASGSTPAPSSPWTTYHPHRPSHAHPGAAALAAPGTVAFAPGGAGYIVQPIPGRAPGEQGTAPGTGYYPVMHPHGMVPFHPPPGYALAPIASEDKKPEGEGEYGRPAETSDDSERLRTVPAETESDEKPAKSSQRSIPPAIHPGAPWQYYTPHHGFPPYPYAMPTPSTSTTPANAASLPGQQAPATPTPTPTNAQQTAYPTAYHPHMPQQGYYAHPTAYGYPTPYGYPPYPYAAAPAQSAQEPAPTVATPAVAATTVASAPAPVSTPTRTPPPAIHSVASVTNTVANAARSQTIGGLGYTFASSSERDNTGSAGGGYPHVGKAASDDEDTHEERDDEEHGSSPSPKHGMSMTSESNERARHPPTRDAREAPSSRGDFHSRNSGDATRSGFRVTCDPSAPHDGSEEVKEDGETIVVKVEDDEDVSTHTMAENTETTDAARMQEPTDSAPAVAQPVSQRTESIVHVGQPQDVAAVPSRPRSSLGFTEPSVRLVGSQRGILDEMCKRRELPFKSVDEHEEQYQQKQKQAPAGTKTALSSSPGAKVPSSDSDPFGGSTMAIPVPSRLAAGKPQPMAYRSKRPRSASGLVIRRPTRLPSRSPDIFDRMSSDPPSGGLEGLSGDEEQVVPLRLRRADAREVPSLGGDLSDTDVEDVDQVEDRKRSRLPSSGTSGEYAPPSSTSTSRTLMVLATPVNKVESDNAAVAPATSGVEYASTSGGRSLRFVASSANASTGKKRKLELTEEDDKENTSGLGYTTFNASATKSGVRPTLGRIASLDYYAGSPAKRSCSLGAEARRLSQVMSKYQQKASPLEDMPLAAATRPRHALGELKTSRKLNGSSSAHQFGKPGRVASSAASRYASDKVHLGLGGAVGVVRSLSVGNLETRATESLSTSGGTEDEECARLLLGLGSSR